MSTRESRPLLALIAFTILAACGGGGGGGGGGTTAGGNPPGSPPVGNSDIDYNGLRLPWASGEEAAFQKTQAAIATVNLIEHARSHFFPLPAGSGISEEYYSSNGGVLTLRGNIDSRGQGRIILDFTEYRFGQGIQSTGRIVQTTGPYSPTAGQSVGLEFQGLTTQAEGDMPVEIRGNLDWQDGVDDTVVDTYAAELSVRALNTDDTLWLNQVTLDLARIKPNFDAARGDVLSGRIYLASRGYIDIDSVAELRYGTLLLGEPLTPSAGGPLRIRDSDSSFDVYPLSQTYFAIAVDNDDDGKIDRSQRFAWASLLEMPLVGATEPPTGAAFSTSAVPPVRSADGGLFVAPVGTEVRLPGLGSHGGSGFLTSQWSLVLAPPGSTPLLEDADSPVPAFTADVEGDYLLLLTVTDGNTVSEGHFTVSARADAVDVVPARVQFLEAPERASVGSVVMLDGSGSYETFSGRIPTGFDWTLSPPVGSLAALSSQTGPTVNFVPDVPGVYNIWFRPKFGGFRLGESITAQVHVDVDFEFHPPTVFRTAGSTRYVEVYDVTGDGVADLVTKSRNSGCVGAECEFDRLVVYAGGADNFDALSETLVSQGPMKVLSLDDDNRLGLLIVGGSSLELLTDLDQAVPTSVQIPHGMACGDARVVTAVDGDVDGDGRTDLLGINYCDDVIALRYQQQDGSFGDPISIDAPEARDAGLAALGDLNSDGKPDLVLSGSRAPSGFRGHPVFVLLGDGAGGFNMSQFFTQLTCGNNSSIDIEDVDGDGRLDLLWRSCDTLSIHRQLDDGRLDDGTRYDPILMDLATEFAAGVTILDVNGDDLGDLILTGRSGTVLGIRQADSLAFELHAPRGAFSPPDDGVDLAFPTDWNGDGAVDFVARTLSGTGVTVVLGRRR